MSKDLPTFVLKSQFSIPILREVDTGIDQWLEALNSFLPKLKQDDTVLKNISGDQSKKATITLTVNVNSKLQKIQLNVDNIEGAILVLKTIFEKLEAKNEKN